MSEPTKEIEVKGNTFVSTLTAVEALRGAEFRAAVLARLPKESGDAFRYGSVISAGWYPVRWYRELHAAIVEEAGDIHYPRQVGRASMRVEMTGAHRMFLRIISVDLMQKQGARFFGSYFRPVRVTVERMAPGLSQTHFAGCDGFDRNVWLEQAGCIEELLIQSGVRAPRVRFLSGGGDGDSDAILETGWR